MVIITSIAKCSLSFINYIGAIKFGCWLRQNLFYLFECEIFIMRDGFVTMNKIIILHLAMRKLSLQNN